MFVEMDFVDYGDFATSVRTQDASSRFSVIVFMGGKKEEQTSEMVRGSVIPNWSAAFGAPEIMATCGNFRFVGGVFRNFVLIAI